MKFREKVNHKTENLAGGIAYKQGAELELVSLLLTSFVEDQFYRKASDQLSRLKKLIAQIPNKQFILKAILYARNEFGLRSITHAAIVELLPYFKGWHASALYKSIAQTFRRPDDILEVVAFWKKNNKGGLPNILRKAINCAIEGYDEYRLTKYRGERSTVKMVDVFNLTHPKPTTPERESLYKRLMSGELKNVDTWESKLSKAGQEGDTQEEVETLKGAAWKELLTSKKLGYFALLRNLRNIIEQAPDCIDLACEALVEEKEIKHSLVFPFRFMTATEAINESSNKNIFATQKLKLAIDKAIEISLNNVPTFEGSTLIVLDKSSSMRGKPIKIGALFTAVLLKKNPSAHLILFADKAINCPFDHRTPVVAFAENIENFTHPQLWDGTNFHRIFPAAQQKYDRVIILSDMQGWMGDHNTPQKELEQYKKKFNADPYIYSFDLQGYGSMQFKSNKVFCIAGFSDKIFNMVKLMELDKEALFKTISNYEIPVVK